MSQAPTYNDIRANQQAQAQAASAAQAQQATGQQVQGEVQGNKNAILQDYMNKQRGLGNPNEAVMNAANMAQGRNQEQYATAAVDAVMAGKLEPAVFMEDPSIPDDYKTMVLGLMQGGPQDQAPAGLGQIQ